MRVCQNDILCCEKWKYTNQNYQILEKRRPEMDGRGFYGDTFSSGFGDFYTAKRGDIPRDVSQYRQLIKVICGFTHELSI